MRPLREAIHRETKRGLGAAVHRNRPFSRRGIQERLFTLAFRNLVYPQIWEDRSSTWRRCGSGRPIG